MTIRRLIGLMPVILGLLWLGATPASAQTTFGTPTLYDTNSDTVGIAFADLNNDGHQDLIVATCENGSIRVRLGDGTGAFGAPADYFLPLPDPDDLVTPFPSAFGIAVADFDHDGNLDVATAADFQGRVYVLFGDGTGALPDIDSFFVGTFPNTVIAADFNGDGNLDLAVPNTGSGDVSVLLGDGLRGFEEVSGSPYLAGSNPWALRAGLLNGDSIPDLVIADPGGDQLVILIGNGDGTFSDGTPIAFDPDTAPVDVVVFDFNGDTIPDLAAVGQNSDQLFLFQGLGDGTYNALTPLDTGFAPSSMAIADFDLDGFTDIVVANEGDDTITIFNGDGTSVVEGDTFPTTTSPDFAFPLVIATGDANEDGRIDVGVGHEMSLDSAVLLNETCCLVTVTRTGTGTGTVTSTPGGINCGPACAQGFNAAVGPELTAVADAGSVFAGWSGDCTGTGSCVLSPGSAANVTAVFDATTFPTTTITFDMGTTYSDAPQDIALAATVSSSEDVNSGTVTFTVRSGPTVIGVPVTSGTVSEGSTSAVYVLPGGIAPQTLSIEAVYNGDATFQTSTGTANLVIDQAPTGVVPNSPFVAFSASSQIVSLSATVASAGGTVTGGTVTFTVSDGGGTLGSPVSGPVSGGAAAASYTLPAGTPMQALTISAAFSGTVNFAANAGTGTLTVGCTPIDVGPASAPVVLLGRPYSLTFTSSVGGATFGVTGTPPGLTLSGATLSGTPTTLGRFDVTVTATAGACSGNRTLALSVMRPPRFLTGAGGGAPMVREYDGLGNQTRSHLAADPSFGGGIRVAMGDVNGDGVDDIIAAPGPGAPTATVTVIDGASGNLIRAFLAYGVAPSGGTYVAAGDVNGDGLADIITGRDGAPPEVKAFDGLTGSVIADFLAYPASVGGVRVAVGDVNGDGWAEIITAPAPGVAPEVRVFNIDGSQRGAFLAYSPLWFGGAFVAAGDIDGDGLADIITGSDAGGGPHVLAYSGVDFHGLRSFFAYTPFFPGGVRVAAADLDLDGHAEIITASGPGGGPHVKVFDGATGTEMFGFYAGGVPTDSTGVFVGGPLPQSRMAIDVPTPSSTVPSGFTVGGWAAMGDATADNGVAAIHVWAFPAAGGAPIFFGATTDPVARPDVGAIFGGAFAEAGFNVTGSLSPGTYDLVIYGLNSRSNTWSLRRIVRVTVP